MATEQDKLPPSCPSSTRFFLPCSFTLHYRRFSRIHFSKTPSSAPTITSTLFRECLLFYASHVAGLGSASTTIAAAHGSSVIILCPGGMGDKVSPLLHFPFLAFLCIVVFVFTQDHPFSLVILTAWCNIYRSLHPESLSRVMKSGVLLMMIQPCCKNRQEISSLFVAITLSAVGIGKRFQTFP